MEFANAWVSLTLVTFYILEKKNTKAKKKQTKHSKCNSYLPSFQLVMNAPIDVYSPYHFECRYVEKYVEYDSEGHWCKKYRYPEPSWNRNDATYITH